MGCKKRVRDDATKKYDEGGEANATQVTENNNYHNKTGRYD